jgi:hypothetical protein
MRSGYILAGLLALAFGGLAGGCHRSPPPAARSIGEAGRPRETAPLTAEACRACDGDFGPHGLDPTPRCNCRTQDPGKRCRGKDECEAECVADVGDREITDPGPPARGFWVGRCADLHTTFGCHVFLPPRAPGSAAVTLDPPPQQLCVD